MPVCRQFSRWNLSLLLKLPIGPATLPSLFIADQMRSSVLHIRHYISGALRMAGRLEPRVWRSWRLVRRSLKTGDHSRVPAQVRKIYDVSRVETHNDISAFVGCRAHRGSTARSRYLQTPS